MPPQLESSCRASALVAILCSLCSCVSVRAVRYSAPFVDDSRVIRREPSELGDLFVTDDVGFAILPANSVSHGLTLLPFPMHGPERAPHGPGFLVLIRLVPATEDLRLDVSQIQFWRGSADRLAPTFFQEPANCQPLGEPRRFVPATTVEIKRGGCSSLWVEFDIPPPNPTQPFAMKIGGLSTGGGRAIDLPEVAFHFSRRVRSSALP